MSRSYKKNPYVTEGYGKDRRYSKRIANRAVRQRLKNKDDTPVRSQHKK